MKQKLGGNNKISEVKKFAEDNAFYDDITDDEFFVFGADFGTGNDDDHFQIGFTSKALINRIPEAVIFHCDGTYKVLKLGFPLMVLGISDINRKFWPIGFMFSSHEQKEDYFKFFTKIKNIAKKCGVNFDPHYMIIDACKAMAYALRKCFPKCTIIMCWFHLKYNIRKKKHWLGSKYKKVLNHINALHNTTNQLEFLELWKKIEKIWLKKKSMKKFHKYFKKQWIESSFSNWQIFKTPPGYATTNNPIESYNNKIKTFFTNRLKLNIVPALEIFKSDCIVPESKSVFYYGKEIKITTNLENKAKLLSNAKFTKFDEHLYEYKHTKGTISNINLINRTCTCHVTVDKGICLHLIKAAIIQNYRLPGMVSLDKFSIRKMRKKIENKDEDDGSSSSCSENEETETSVFENNVIEATQNVVHKEITKRGRPAKIAKALVVDTEPDRVKKLVNKSKKTPLVAVRSSNILKNKNNLN